MLPPEDHLSNPQRQDWHRCLVTSLLGIGLAVIMPAEVRAEVSLEQYTPVELTAPQPVLSDSIARQIVREQSRSAPEPLEPEVLLPVSEPIHLVLKLQDRRLYVYRGEHLETSYPVAIGRPGWETPTGQFQVRAMLEDPGWTNPFTGEVTPPGAANPLGERWIAFWSDGSNEIGFHGTPNRESVGEAASHGCVRMYNEDIRELYQQVRLGTVVRVEP